MSGKFVFGLFIATCMAGAAWAIPALRGGWWLLGIILAVVFGAIG